jgi:hypothetical protein
MALLDTMARIAARTAPPQSPMTGPMAVLVLVHNHITLITLIVLIITALVQHPIALTAPGPATLAPALVVAQGDGGHLRGSLERGSFEGVT